MLVVCIVAEDRRLRQVRFVQCQHHGMSVSTCFLTMDLRVFIRVGRAHLEPSIDMGCRLRVSVEGWLLYGRTEAWKKGLFALAHADSVPATKLDRDSSSFQPASRPTCRQTSTVYCDYTQGKVEVLMEQLKWPRDTKFSRKTSSPTFLEDIYQK